MLIITNGAKEQVDAVFVAIEVKASEVDKIFGVNDTKDDAAAASVLFLLILEASDCTGVDVDTQTSVVHTFLLIGVAADAVVVIVVDAELKLQVYCLCL